MKIVNVLYNFANLKQNAAVINEELSDDGTIKEKIVHDNKFATIDDKNEETNAECFDEKDKGFVSSNTVKRHEVLQTGGRKCGNTQEKLKK